MMNPKWKIDDWCPEKNKLYHQLHQSTMDSRFNKARIGKMTPQTQAIQTIHPEECIEMITPRMKLQKQWELRNQSIKEQLTHEPARTKDKQKEPYVKGKGKTEIMKLVARRPEIQEAMALSRDDGKNWKK